jgi:hypothetical protein
MLATPKGLSDEKAARMMAALREGRTLRLFGVTAPRLQTYFEAHPEYAQEARPLIEANATAARLRKGSRLRDRRFCKYGHPLSGSYVYLSRGRGYRQCKICTARNSQFPSLPTEDQIKQVTAALNMGQTIGQICFGKMAGKKVGGFILKFNKLKRYRELNPDFDRFVCSVISGSNNRAQQRRHNPQLYSVNVLRSETNDYHAVAAMVPSNLPPEVRDDIVQSIFMALLEGSLRRDEVKARIGQFVKAHNREANKHDTGKYGLISLDAPIFADGSTTRGDMVSRGLWD